jgi:hypothetical protein
MGSVAGVEADGGPRAPTQAAWDAMSPAERAAVLERLGPIPETEAAPSEGDWHIEAVRVSEDALGGHFEKRNRGVYIGRGNTVYYPDERRFAPDLFIVLDVETHKRTVWVLNQEQRGLDFVLEVHYFGVVEKTQRRTSRGTRGSGSPSTSCSTPGGSSCTGGGWKVPVLGPTRGSCPRTVAGRCAVWAWSSV